MNEGNTSPTPVPVSPPPGAVPASSQTSVPPTPSAVPPAAPTPSAPVPPWMQRPRTPAPQQPTAPLAFASTAPVPPPTSPDASEEKNWGPLKPIRKVPKPSDAKAAYILAQSEHVVLPEDDASRRKTIIIGSIVGFILIAGGSFAFIKYGRDVSTVKTNAVQVVNTKVGNVNTSNVFPAANTNTNANSSTPTSNTNSVDDGAEVGDSKVFRSDDVFTADKKTLLGYMELTMQKGAINPITTPGVKLSTIQPSDSQFSLDLIGGKAVTGFYEFDPAIQLLKPVELKFHYTSAAVGDSQVKNLQIYSNKGKYYQEVKGQKLDISTSVLSVTVNVLDFYAVFDKTKISPAKFDSDGDGYSDADELKNGYNPYGPGKL